MTKSEIARIRSALELLHELVPPEEPHPGSPAPRRCPVTLFAQRYLAPEPGSDLASKELWKFFAEVAATRELEPLSKAEFLSRLPGVMELTFDLRKSHNIQRAGRRVRGFCGVGIRLDPCPPDVLEVEAEVGVDQQTLTVI
jgi:hypothetical protein